MTMDLEQSQRRAGSQGPGAGGWIMDRAFRVGRNGGAGPLSEAGGGGGNPCPYPLSLGFCNEPCNTHFQLYKAPSTLSGVSGRINCLNA